MWARAALTEPLLAAGGHPVQEQRSLSGSAQTGWSALGGDLPEGPLLWPRGGDLARKDPFFGS